MENERRQVLYRGLVQGVGFRYMACNIAQRYQVQGYVMNMPDRSVQLVVEGAADELDRFLAELAETMSGKIRDTIVELLPASGEFGEFRIEH